MAGPWASIFLAASVALGSSAWFHAEAAEATVSDFSGMWVHPYFPGIEPPPSGPGPVFNKLRRPNGQSNNSQWIGDYTNPILKPEAAEVVKQHGEISASGLTYPTPSNRCWPSGVPYIFFQPGMQMLQRESEIVFLYMRDHEVRHVRMNQPHPQHVTPSWYGDSVGHYEGDTLVIDTIGQTNKTFIDNYRTPHTEKLHVVERFRMIDEQDRIRRHVRVFVNDREAPTLAEPVAGGDQVHLICALSGG